MPWYTMEIGLCVYYRERRVFFAWPLASRQGVCPLVSRRSLSSWVGVELPPALCKSLGAGGLLAWLPCNDERQRETGDHGNGRSKVSRLRKRCFREDGVRRDPPHKHDDKVDLAHNLEAGRQRGPHVTRCNYAPPVRKSSSSHLDIVNWPFSLDSTRASFNGEGAGPRVTDPSAAYLLP